jgi:hypothetical protein
LNSPSLLLMSFTVAVSSSTCRQPGRGAKESCEVPKSRKVGRRRPLNWAT